MDNEITARLSRISQYLDAMNASVNTIKAASLVGHEKDVFEIARNFELAVNELEKEFSNLRTIDIKEESIRTAVNARVVQLLIDASKRLEKKDV